MALEYDRAGLLATIHQQFRVDWHGIHGIRHWSRVLHHTRTVGALRGADLLLVELFSFLHDSCRHDELRDPQHGARGADFARSLNTRFFDLSAARLDRLCQAIRWHSDGQMSADATIQTCWDADRLDLGRVGIYPDTRLVSREAATRIEAAYGWSRGRSLRPLSPSR